LPVDSIVFLHVASIANGTVSSHNDKLQQGHHPPRNAATKHRPATTPNQLKPAPFESVQRGREQGLGLVSSCVHHSAEGELKGGVHCVGQ
jgi:hypothetical protein